MIKYLLLSIIFPIFVITKAIGQPPTDPVFYDLDFKKTDRELLAALINSECGICGQREQILVGATVINRMKTRKLSLRDVVFQPYQYAGVRTEHFYATKQTLKVADYLLDPNNTIPYVHYFVTKEIRDSCFAKNLEISFTGDYHYYFK